MRHRTTAPKPADRDLAFLHQRIAQVGEPDADGSVHVAFELSARSHWIDPKLSPDAAAMVAFARRAAAEKKLVHATCWVRDRRPKTPENMRTPGIADVIVRLADDPDPRQPR